MIDQVLEWAMRNGVGAMFGLLMFYLANTSIKKNTEAIDNLREFLNRRL